MVVLNRIYTRTGDQGETGIGDGSRVSKLHPRIVAGGSVDETNSLLGLAAAHVESAEFRTLVEQLQQALFDLGADLTCPPVENAADDKCPRVSAEQITWIENQIDHFNAGLSAMKSFILPGGSPAAAFVHCARSVCRRAELDLLRFLNENAGNPLTAVFMNRLSDLLFVLARCLNDNGKNDVLWQIDRRPPGTPDAGADPST